MTKNPPSDKTRCIKGKKIYDDGCYDCQYWIEGKDCPPEKKKV